jgi:hypothetical protein
MVPAFSGPDNLGFNASTFLNLQIFRTLRQKPTPNPNNLDFGHGEVLWSETELPKQLHTLAETLAKDYNFSAQMTLWGKVWHYGSGLMVQSYLSIPKYSDYRDYRHEVWEESIIWNSRTFFFHVDIPRRRLMFSPFFLTKDFIKQYASPLSIQMLALPNSSAREVGRVGLRVKAHKVEKDWAKVSSGGKIGWVNLPIYSSQPVESINFVGGMIRIFRGDWQGAYDMFEDVLSIPNLPTSLKVDVLLLQARALEEQRKDGSIKLKEALVLSPYSEKVVQYQLMQIIRHLSSSMKHAAGNQKSLSVKHIDDLLKRKAYLFPPNDPFISKIRKLMSVIKSSPDL